MKRHLWSEGWGQPEYDPVLIPLFGAKSVGKVRQGSGALLIGTQIEQTESMTTKLGDDFEKGDGRE